MLVINGALAAWNGVIAATGKFWCECVRGGICCGGECRCDEGECCAGEWINDDGTVDGREGTWVCCPDSNGWVSFGALTASDPGCVGFSRCCTDGECSDASPEECLGDVLSGSCANFGCPKSCCSENADGLVSCETVDEMLCVLPRVVDEEPCESACKGACCLDGELTEGSPTTQAECDALGGCWYGVGSTECGEGFCRAPFDQDCCEHVVSSAAAITFTGPRKRRCPEFDGCGFSVTVSVTTGQPVYVHGNQYGNPYESCTEVATFVTCNDTFHVTPAPCPGSLNNLDIEVCWDDGSGPELLRFHCCDGTYLLGNCECDCVTTLLYEGAGCTSAATLQLNGDAIIEANGTGPLVLTENITHAGSCSRTLTLTGTSPYNNEIQTPGNPSGGTLELVKTGTGVWHLAGSNNYSGGLLVQAGTLRIASDVYVSGDTPFGSGSSPLPKVSGTSSLLAGGVLIGRDLRVQPGAGTVIIGGNGTFAGSILLGKNVTLAADNSATATFSGAFRDENNGASPAVALKIGTPTMDGTVVFDSVLALPASITSVSIEHGTLVVNQILSGPAIVASSTFTSSTLTVDFLSPPAQGDTFRLLPGVTAQSYTPVLTNAGGATGTYNSATSTLTID